MAHSIDDFVKTVPVSDLAQKFGVGESDLTEAISLAAPALLGGMAVNASTEEGASKLIAATGKHQTKAASLADVDTADGQKIVKKVLGEKQSAVTSALETQAGSSSIAGLIPKLLPILAPLIMQYLSGSLSKDSSTTQSESGGLGDILGGLLGGGSQQSQSGGLGDILGGLLGGGSQQNQSGGLGGILGSILGK